MGDVVARLEAALEEDAEDLVVVVDEEDDAVLGLAEPAAEAWAAKG